MNQSMSNNDKKTIIDDAVNDGNVSKTMSKLTKSFVEVEFYSQQNELDLLDFSESRIKAVQSEDRVFTTEETNNLNTELDNIANKKKELEVHKIKAILVPLKYQDIRIVKTAISEALLAVTNNNLEFSLDTKIIMTIEEEKVMTVYLSLRKRDNKTEKYFSSPEEVVTLSDRTLQYLYDSYVDNFKLSETERKN